MKKPLNNVARLSGIGFQVAITVGLGAWLGSWLDEKYPAEKKWYTLLCVLVFTAIAMYNVLQQVKRINDNEDNAKKDS